MLNVRICAIGQNLQLFVGLSRPLGFCEKLGPQQKFQAKMKTFQEQFFSAIGKQAQIYSFQNFLKSKTLNQPTSQFCQQQNTGQWPVLLVAAYWPASKMFLLSTYSLLYCISTYSQLYIFRAFNLHHLNIREHLIYQHSQLKGAVSRDFLPLFFHESLPSGPLINRLKQFFLKIRFHEDIRIFWTSQPFKKLTTFFGICCNCSHIYIEKI